MRKPSELMIRAESVPVLDIGNSGACWAVTNFLIHAARHDRWQFPFPEVVRRFLDLTDAVDVPASLNCGPRMVDLKKERILVLPRFGMRPIEERIADLETGIIEAEKSGLLRLSLLENVTYVEATPELVERIAAKSNFA